MWKGLERVYPNTPIADEATNNDAKDKTIVLSRDAHVILNNVKYDKNLKTISDAIEWLCGEWKSIKTT
jgi:hypothetical protein